MLYLVKTNNDFYGIQYSIKYTWHRTSLPKTCGHRIVQLTIKSGESWSCRSMSTIRQYWMLMIWSGAWLLHGRWSGLQQHVINKAWTADRWHLGLLLWLHEQSFYVILLLTLLDCYLMWQSDFYGDFIFDAELTVLYGVKIVASFYKVQDEHIKREVVGCVYVICFSFPPVCFFQKLAKLDDIWRSYNKYKKGDVFFWDTVY